MPALFTDAWDIRYVAILVPRNCGKSKQSARFVGGRWSGLSKSSKPRIRKHDQSLASYCNIVSFGFWIYFHTSVADCCMCVVQKARIRGNQINERRRSRFCKFSKPCIKKLIQGHIHTSKLRAFALVFKTQFLPMPKKQGTYLVIYIFLLVKPKLYFLLYISYNSLLFIKIITNQCIKNKQDSILLVSYLFGLYVLLRFIDFNTWFLLDVEHFSQGEVIIFL